QAVPVREQVPPVAVRPGAPAGRGRAAHPVEGGREVLAQRGMIVEVRIGEAVRLIPSVHLYGPPLGPLESSCASRGPAWVAPAGTLRAARRELSQPRRRTDKTARTL